MKLEKFLDLLQIPVALAAWVWLVYAVVVELSK